MKTNYFTDKVYYLAGPMTGIPQFNIPMFTAVASELRDRGLSIVNPAELDSAEMQEEALASRDGDLAMLEAATDETWGDVLARDVKVIADEVDAIILLPGWERSRGASLEAYVATLCGHELYLYEPHRAGLHYVAPAEIKRLLR